MPVTIQIGDHRATVGLPRRDELWQSENAALELDLNRYSRFSLYGSGHTPNRDLSEAEEVVAEARRAGKDASIVLIDQVEDPDDEGDDAGIVY